LFDFIILLYEAVYRGCLELEPFIELFISAGCASPLQVYSSVRLMLHEAIYYNNLYGF